MTEIHLTACKALGDYAALDRIPRDLPVAATQWARDDLPTRAGPVRWQHHLFRRIYLVVSASMTTNTLFAVRLNT